MTEENIVQENLQMETIPLNNFKDRLETLLEENKKRRWARDRSGTSKVAKQLPPKIDKVEATKESNRYTTPKEDFLLTTSRTLPTLSQKSRCVDITREPKSLQVQAQEMRQSNSYKEVALRQLLPNKKNWYRIR